MIVIANEKKFSCSDFQVNRTETERQAGQTEISTRIIKLQRKMFCSINVVRAIF